MDVNLKVPAFDLLVKYAASGIGAMAGPILVPWKAWGAAKAKLIGVLNSCLLEKARAEPVRNGQKKGWQNQKSDAQPHASLDRMNDG